MSTASPRRPGHHRQTRWSPSDNDHLIFRWVKLDGESQSWVADQFGISQSTVSRIVQRYERWQAHAEEREGGRLDHTERLRYQRWLTSERNEQIIASCLRIAQKLEGFIDSSRSTTLHAQRYPADQTKVRTEHFTIDRTASVCRFLRLAHRINMDQLKLAQLAPPPPPNPLSVGELADEQREIAAIQDDFAAAQRRSAEQLAQEQVQPQEDLKYLQELEEAERRELEQQLACAPPSDPELVTRVHPGNAPPRGSSLVEPANAELSPTLNLEPETLNSTPHHSPAPVHNLHSEPTSQIAATPDEHCTCTPTIAPKKKSKPSRITADVRSDSPTNKKSKRPLGRPLASSTA